MVDNPQERFLPLSQYPAPLEISRNRNPSDVPVCHQAFRERTEDGLINRMAHPKIIGVDEQ
jgi:hypothetical protein